MDYNYLTDREFIINFRNRMSTHGDNPHYSAPLNITSTVNRDTFGKEIVRVGDINMGLDK